MSDVVTARSRESVGGPRSTRTRSAGAPALESRARRLPRVEAWAMLARALGGARLAGACGFRLRRLVAVGCLHGLCALAACSWPTRYAQTANGPAETSVTAGTGGSAITPPPPHDAGTQRDTGTPPPRDAGGSRADAGSSAPRDAGVSHPDCPESLDQRLTVSRIDTGIDIRYKRPGYDGFPLDESVLFSVSPAGRMVLAVRENSGSRLLTIKLSPQLTRSDTDVIVYASDLGGLVAHDDGTFVLLTRRDDLGEQLRDPTTQDSIGKAAVLIRLQGTRELFAQPLTGTTSITRVADPRARDCAPLLNGRLAWNGVKYAAYFAVHGCEGDPHAPYYGDKLVYVDPSGNYLPGGWSWNCSLSHGMRMLPNDTGPFTTLCMSDGQPFAGLNLVTEGVPARQLSPEKAGAGALAAGFGSVVRMADGSYVVALLSRSVPEAQLSATRPDRALKRAPDIALVRFGKDYAPIGTRTWLAETPNVAETNLHIAPYGPDRLLVVWDNIEDLNCSEWTCFGTYTGTSARLIDKLGNFLTPDVRIDAPPNTEQDIVVFPNGDLGWAFVPDDARNYAAALPVNRGVPNVPVKQRLSVARLRYCE